jgi:hypothetical protein
MVAGRMAMLFRGDWSHGTHRILRKTLFMVRFSIDDSAPINSFFILFDAIVAECDCPTFGQLLAQFLKLVKECMLLARIASLHGLVSPWGGPAVSFWEQYSGTRRVVKFLGRPIGYPKNEG